MQQKTWKECFPKNSRPEITDIENFMDRDTYGLFRRFADSILTEYDLRFGIPVWSEKSGWTYRIGKSGVYLVTGILIEKNCFVMAKREVTDLEQLQLALNDIKEIYIHNEVAFHAKIAEKNKLQMERTAKRIAREQAELLALQNQIVPEKYNVFHWPDKLDISKLNKLYQLDARGIQDEQLADDIGLTLYLRCKYGKEDMQRMERKVLRCHMCDNEIAGTGDFRVCSCGQQYSYREYRRNYRRNNMPTGAATPTFERFVSDWNTAKCYQEKISLIDALLHEFHLSLVSGAVHRPVAMNFIDGSRERVERIINNLARE